MRSQAEVEELRSKVSLKMRQELVSPETDVGGPLGTAVTRVTRNAQRISHNLRLGEGSQAGSQSGRRSGLGRHWQPARPD